MVEEVREDITRLRVGGIRFSLSTCQVVSEYYILTDLKKYIFVMLLITLFIVSSLLCCISE